MPGDGCVDAPVCGASGWDVQMGHADLQALHQYLAQTTEDIALAHRMGSPVDNFRL
jgi:hypothetical protein